MKSLAALGVAVLLSVAAADRPAPAVAPAVPFINDDYGKALALARTKKLPLFVEAWAPW